MTAPADPTVTLHVWRVPARRVPAAAIAGRSTVRRLRRRPDVRFAKLLGTSSAAFSPRAATPRRWAAIVCWHAAPDDLRTWFDRHADERAWLSLRVLSTRGSWDGSAPFGDATPTTGAGDDGDGDGPILVLTRSTVRWRRARRFYRAVPPIAAALAASPDCRVAFGIGEAPVVRQGTVSLWTDVRAMTRFAHGSPPHRAAVDATPREQWYAEELFTRFAVVDANGIIDGVAL